MLTQSQASLIRKEGQAQLDRDEELVRHLSRYLTTKRRNLTYHTTNISDELGYTPLEDVSHRALLLPNILTPDQVHPSNYDQGCREP